MRVSCLITIGYSLVAATALPAQAVITGNDDRTEHRSLGPDGHIVTAGHCVDSTKSNRVPSRARDVGSRGGLTFKRRSGI